MEGIAMNYDATNFSMLPAISFLILSFAILVYVFHSLGLYTIAKRRGLRLYGLAWVPIANLWVLGCVADQYDEVHTGKNMKLRKHLLWLSIVYIVLYIVFYIIFIGIILTSLFTFAYFSNYTYLMVWLPFLFISLLLPFIIALSIFGFMAYYKLYRSCNPDKAVVLLVFSIAFGIIIPFVLFALRKSDRGMPAPQPQTEQQM